MSVEQPTQCDLPVSLATKLSQKPPSTCEALSSPHSAPARIIIVRIINLCTDDCTAPTLSPAAARGRIRVSTDSPIQFQIAAWSVLTQVSYRYSLS